MIEMIDSHAHLYAAQFDQDRTEMIERALSAGVVKMYLPNIDLESIKPMLKICADYPNHLFPMMGLHPCSVNANFNDVLDTMERYFDDNTYVGIGETGIDLYWDKTSLDWQIASFNRQVQWAKDKNLPIIIHSRSALDITIDMIAANQDDRLGGIFHCFDGTIEQAEQIMDLGFYLGIGGVVTYKKSHLPEVIKKIGLSKVVLETDSPYLSPVPNRGKRNESSYLAHIAEYLAQLLEVDIATVADLSSQNVKRIFVG